MQTTPTTSQRHTHHICTHRNIIKQHLACHATPTQCPNAGTPNLVAHLPDHATPTSNATPTALILTNAGTARSDGVHRAHHTHLPCHTLYPDLTGEAPMPRPHSLSSYPDECRHGTDEAHQLPSRGHTHACVPRWLPARRLQCPAQKGRAVVKPEHVVLILHIVIIEQLVQLRKLQREYTSPGSALALAPAPALTLAPALHIVIIEQLVQLRKLEREYTSPSSALALAPTLTLHIVIIEQLVQLRKLQREYRSSRNTRALAPAPSPPNSYIEQLVLQAADQVSSIPKIQREILALVQLIQQLA